MIQLIGVDEDNDLWVVVDGVIYCVWADKGLLREEPGVTQWSDVVEHYGGRLLDIDKDW